MADFEVSAESREALANALYGAPWPSAFAREIWTQMADRAIAAGWVPAAEFGAARDAEKWDEGAKAEASWKHVPPVNPYRALAGGAS